VVEDSNGASSPKNKEWLKKHTPFRVGGPNSVSRTGASPGTRLVQAVPDIADVDDAGTRRFSPFHERTDPERDRRAVSATTRSSPSSASTP